MNSFRKKTMDIGKNTLKITTGISVSGIRVTWLIILLAVQEYEQFVCFVKTKKLTIVNSYCIILSPSICLKSQITYFTK